MLQDRESMVGAEHRPAPAGVKARIIRIDAENGTLVI
jgi:hypothetical protein